MSHGNAFQPSRMQSFSLICRPSSLYHAAGCDEKPAAASTPAAGQTSGVVQTVQRREGKAFAGGQPVRCRALTRRSSRSLLAGRLNFRGHHALTSIAAIFIVFAAYCPSHNDDLGKSGISSAIWADAFKLHSSNTERALLQTHSQLMKTDPILPSGSEWICREAYNNEGCGTGHNASLGTTEAYCQEEDCCLASTEKCTRIPGLCATDGFLLSQYSWGKCNTSQCARCGPNATCGYIASTTSVRGGVYCTCKPPFVGTGASCVVEACKVRNPCGQGTCVPTTEAGKSYKCDCKPGYTEVSSGTSYSTCVDICTQYGCGSEGVEACIGGIDSYKCVCKQGYRLSEDMARQRCVKNNPCTINPCGPSSAVEKCESQENGIEYKCTCKVGHVVRYVNGTQVCLEEGKPCTAPACSVDPPVTIGTSTSTSSTSNSTNQTGGSESEGVNAGAIAGGVIGGAVVIVICGAGAFFFMKKSQN